MDLTKGVINNEENSQNVEHNVQVFGLSRQQLYADVAKDAETYSIGYRITQHHGYHGDKSGKSIGNIL